MSFHVFLAFVIMALVTPVGASPGITSGAEAVNARELLSFESWKSLRTTTAQMALQQFREELGREGPPANMEILRQLEFNLEIANRLTIHDYFALYLKSKTESELAEVAKILSPQELSELLSAYRKNLFGEPKTKVESK